MNETLRRIIIVLVHPYGQCYTSRMIEFVLCRWNYALTRYWRNDDIGLLLVGLVNCLRTFLCDAMRLCDACMRRVVPPPRGEKSPEGEMDYATCGAFTSGWKVPERRNRLCDECFTHVYWTALWGSHIIWGNDHLNIWYVGPGYSFLLFKLKKLHIHILNLEYHYTLWFIE
jgi:hypothetical protein